MKYRHRFAVVILFTVVVLLTAGLVLSGCGDKTEFKAAAGPAKLEAIPFVGAFNPEGGRAVKGITLTEKAAERLGIEVTEIQAGQGSLRRVFPYAAVLYDPNGGTWVYTMRKPLTYIREPVTIESVEGELAILSQAPAAQTTVVTVGIAMLYGIEYGVGQ